jgi:hypothetical protein
MKKNIQGPVNSPTGNPCPCGESGCPPCPPQPALVPAPHHPASYIEGWKACGAVYFEKLARENAPNAEGSLTPPSEEL